MELSNPPTPPPPPPPPPQWKPHPPATQKLPSCLPTVKVYKSFQLVLWINIVVLFALIYFEQTMQLYNAYTECPPSLYIPRMKFKLVVQFSLDKLSPFCKTRDALILTKMIYYCSYWSCKVANTGLRKWCGHLCRTTGLGLTLNWLQCDCVTSYGLRPHLLNMFPVNMY